MTSLTGQKAKTRLMAMRRAAIEAHQQNDLCTAESLYRQLLGSGSQESGDWANLGAILRSDGRLEEAIAIYEQGLGKWGKDPILCLNASNAFRDAGSLHKSEQTLERCLEEFPGSLPLRHSLAKTWISAGRHEDAVKMLESLAEEDNSIHAIWADLGIANSHLKQGEKALISFQKALKIDPNHCRTRANCITLMTDQRRLEDAQLILNQTPGDLCDNLEVKTAKANLLIAKQEMVEAAILLHQLCMDEPESTQHWLNLGASLRGLKRSFLASKIIRKGISIHPEDEGLQNALLQSLAEQGYIISARRLLNQMNKESINKKSNLVFNLQFLSVSTGLLKDSELMKLAQEWERTQNFAGCKNLWKDYCLEPWSKRRLRIGYLSSDYCNHPVSRFLLPVLENHDRNTVEIWGLHTGPYWDIVSDKIKQNCDHWLDLSCLNDLQAARVITDQRLDVLVELGGYTGNSRLGICLHEPAPIQMSYLGYPGATYLNAVPWWIGDECLFQGLKEESKQHSLVKINGGYMCMPYQIAIVDPEDKTEDAPFRFGSFNHARKLTRRTISLWISILRLCINSELVLKSISFLELAEIKRIRELFLQAGINEDRILLLPWAENFEQHISTYNKIDIGLDPVPYGGATTTAEALGMGIPVVCLQGEGMVCSLSASILRSAGLNDLINNSEYDYINCAVKLYNQGKRSSKRRLTLAEVVTNSQLGDARRVSRGLESAFYQCLKQLRGC